MTYRFGRNSRLFKAQGSGLTMAGQEGVRFAATASPPSPCADPCECPPWKAPGRRFGDIEFEGELAIVPWADQPASTSTPGKGRRRRTRKGRRRSNRRRFSGSPQCDSNQQSVIVNGKRVCVPKPVMIPTAGSHKPKRHRSKSRRLHRRR